jgi:hypothetical protein
MEGKYGRLRQVSVSAEDGRTKVVDTYAKWDDDEPLFLLRSTDHLAPFIVQLYAMLAHLFGLLAVGNGAQHQYWAMRKWQNDHPERVKLPD